MAARGQGALAAGRGPTRPRSRQLGARLRRHREERNSRCASWPAASRSRRAPSRSSRRARRSPRSARSGTWSTSSGSPSTSCSAVSAEPIRTAGDTAAGAPGARTPAEAPPRAASGRARHDRARDGRHVGAPHATSSPGWTSSPSPTRSAGRRVEEPLRPSRGAGVRARGQRTARGDRGFRPYELGPGDSIAFDSNVPHCLRNVGTSRCTACGS